MPQFQLRRLPARRFLARLGAFFGWLGIALLLSHCASKHQPVDYPFYFAEVPEGDFTPALLQEEQRLAAKPVLTLFEKKRLADLAAQELRTLKPGSPRAAVVATTVKRLQPEIADLQHEASAIRDENKKFKDPNEPAPSPRLTFDHAALKRAFGEVYRLWNHDQSETALKKLTAVLDGPSFNGANAQERYKAHQLELRIALELGDVPRAESAYAILHGLDACSELTAQAGFLVALRAFADHDGKKALAIFNAQCDPDHSPSHRLQRDYWLARFTEAAGIDAAPLYARVAGSHMPSYYVYLARRHQGDTVQLLPSSPSRKPYLEHELDMPGEVHRLVSAAETRLAANLRRDASAYLIRASQILRKDLGPKSLLALLYVAHLLQAAGNHLDAMKLYTVATTMFDGLAPSRDTVDIAAIDNEGFLAEMFPRPYGPVVDWLAHEWKTDPDFTYAIMRQESAFNPGALSSAHARGLMQLLPSLARQLSKQWGYQTFYSDKLLLNARENLKLATFHLYQLESLAPHLVLMAASYNAGLARVSGWWKKFGNLPLDAFVEFIPVNETRNYAKLVLRNYIYYKALRSGGEVEASAVPLELPPYPDRPALKVSAIPSRTPSSRRKAMKVTYRKRRARAKPSRS